MKDKGLISVETLVYMEQDGKMFAGHIDLIIRIDDTIYICDYKPNVNFDLSTELITDIFIDTIPQVSGYGVLFSKNIASDLKKNPHLKVRCLTFNRDDYLVTYPKNTLAFYIAFLKKVKGPTFNIVFEKLVSVELIDKYENMMES